MQYSFQISQKFRSLIPLGLTSEENFIVLQFFVVY